MCPVIAPSDKIQRNIAEWKPIVHLFTVTKETNTNWGKFFPFPISRVFFGVGDELRKGYIMYRVTDDTNTSLDRTWEQQKSRWLWICLTGHLVITGIRFVFTQLFITWLVFWDSPYIFRLGILLTVFCIIWATIQSKISSVYCRIVNQLIYNHL